MPRTLFGLDGWRFVVMAGSLGALLAWFVRRHLPESPRWLAEHGRGQEATPSSKAGKSRPGWRARNLPNRSRVTRLRRGGSFREIFRKPYLGRTLMLIAFNLFQAAGYYGFASWVPTLLIASGIEVTKSLGYTFIIAIAAPLRAAAGPAVYRQVRAQMADRGRGAGPLRRRDLAFTQARGMGAVIACGVALTLANNILSFALSRLSAELYPTRIRALGVGFVYSFSRLATMFSAFIIAGILKGFGAPGVFVFIAGCMGVVALVIGLFGPRTRDLPLEAISR